MSLQHGHRHADHDHGHDHHHDHGHHHHRGGHHHGHSHAPASFGRAFAIGTALNTGFVLVEALFGVRSGSMALLADAGHNLGDVLGLLVAWGAASLGQRRPGGRYTYGLRGSSILAALFNAVLLLVAIGAIAVEAVQRLIHPSAVPGGTMMIVAGIGVVVNTATALLFMSGRKSDLNLRGAFTHMAADAAVSAGVVLAGLAILLTGRAWIDPATSLVLVLVIAAGTWGLLRDSIDMSLDAVPPGVDLAAIEQFLLDQAGVEAIHDLHVWPMSTTETALTAHLLLPAGCPGDAFLRGLAAALDRRFGIGHSTLQIETGSDPRIGCMLASSQSA